MSILPQSRDRTVKFGNPMLCVFSDRESEWNMGIAIIARVAIIATTRVAFFKFRFKRRLIVVAFAIPAVEKQSPRQRIAAQRKPRRFMVVQRTPHVIDFLFFRDFAFYAADVPRRSAKTLLKTITNIGTQGHPFRRQPNISKCARTHIFWQRARILTSKIKRILRFATDRRAFFPSALNTFLSSFSSHPRNIFNRRFPSDLLRSTMFHHPHTLPNRLHLFTPHPPFPRRPALEHFPPPVLR